MPIPEYIIVHEGPSVRTRVGEVFYAGPESGWDKQGFLQEHSQLQQYRLTRVTYEENPAKRLMVLQETHAREIRLEGRPFGHISNSWMEIPVASEASARRLATGLVRDLQKTRKHK